MKALLLIPLIVSLISCGPSEEEKARIQKQRDDSVKVATENRLYQKKALEDSLVSYRSIKEGHENRMVYLRSEMEVANAKLQTVKGYQFLRTEEEKNNQIRSAVLKIDEIEKDAKATTERIVQTEKLIVDTEHSLSKYQ